MARELSGRGFRVKIDDTDKSPGWKFSEHEMKGVPVRIEIGPRDLEKGEVVVVTRHDRNKVTMPATDVPSVMERILDDMHGTMLQNARDFVDAHTYKVSTYDDFKARIKAGGYVLMSISGEEAETRIKADTGATARIIPFDQTLITDTCPVTGEKAVMTVMFARAY
jgi:prolyl-tRNA synthetase